MMNTATTYTIYFDKLHEVTKALDRLVRKANRYGVPFKYEVGEEYPKRVAVYSHPDPLTNQVSELYTYMVSAVDITVTMDGLIRQNGWTVLAKVERMPGTELRAVATFGSAKFDPAWENADMHCDHCGTDHIRNTVYIVADEKGNQKSVGKSCLKDYTGISPTSLIDWAAVRDIFPVNLDRMEENAFGAMPLSYRWYSLERVLGLAIDSIERRGYVKSGEQGSTKAMVLDGLAHHRHPSDDAYAKAKEVVAWLNTDEGQREISFMEIGIKAFLESGAIKEAYIGYSCYWPVAYNRYQERIAREKVRAASEAGSEYIAEVGKRVTLDIIDAKVITSWDTEWGTTYVWKMMDTAGNIITWKTSKDAKPGKLTGTVKAHTEYKGVKQTEMTRCKIA